MDSRRTRVVSVAILTGFGLTLAGGWQTAAHGDVDAYLNSPEVGMNISGLSDQSTQWALSDYYLSTGNAWYPISGGSATFDSQGEPILNSGQAQGQNIYLQTAPAADDAYDYPAGQWTVTWNGPVNMAISGDTVNSSGQSQNYSWTGNGRANTETFNVAPGSAGLYLIEKYNTSDTGSQSATNVHVYAPGYAPGQPNAGQLFTTQFTQGLQAFGTTRFMDAMNTNGDSTAWGNLSTSTSPGPQLSDATWTGSGGMPVAAMVSLANQTNTNPWFCMPANASDAYITQFAQYVKTNLNSNLKVYVEYANEDWSTLNPSGQRIQSQSGGASNGPTFDANWAADVSQVFKDWENVYTGSSSGVSSQLVRVAAIQTVNSYDAPMFLSSLHTDGGFDAVADAPYFGPTSANIASYTSTTTAQQILNDMIANIQSQASPTGDWTWNMQLAKQYGVPLIGYEGGQGLAPGSTSVSWYQAYLAAEANPQMEQIYQLWLETYLNDVGASEVNNFSYVGEPGAYGAWGSMDYQGDPNAPKYDGLLDYIEGVPEPATLGLFLPAAGLCLMRRRHRGSRT